MEFLTEKQMTQRAPIRPLEVTYVNADAHDIDSDDGYQFQFPQSWAMHGSTNKLIGIRRMICWPCPAFMKFKLWTLSDSLNPNANKSGWTYSEKTELWTPPEDWDYDADTGFWNPPEDMTEEDVPGYNYDQTLDKFAGEDPVGDFRFSFKYNQDLGDIIEKIEDTMTEKITGYSVYFTYNPDTLNLTITVEDSDGEAVPFKFTFVYGTNDYASEFLKIFSQKITNDAIANVKLAHDTLTFTSVWDRAGIFYHASFSDSSRQIIGFNGDEWDTASVYYSGNLTSVDFMIRFTQDTVTKVMPRHGTFMIQLSLIYNYDNTFLLMR